MSDKRTGNKLPLYNIAYVIVVRNELLSLNNLTGDEVLKNPHCGRKYRARVWAEHFALLTVGEEWKICEEIRQMFSKLEIQKG